MIECVSESLIVGIDMKGEGLGKNSRFYIIRGILLNAGAGIIQSIHKAVVKQLMYFISKKSPFTLIRSISVL